VKTKVFFRLVAVLLVLSVFAVAEAAELGLTVQQVDTSQFPKVRVEVSVADSQGVPITGLDRQAFELREGNQEISDFQVEPIINAQEPVAIALIIDVSGSMASENRLGHAKQAASAFIDTMGPRDSAAVISFASDVQIVQGYTSDKATLKSAVDKLEAKGNTALYDSVLQASQLQGALPQRRKVMLVLADGEDNQSKQTIDASIAAVRGSGALLFVVALGSEVKKDVIEKLVSSTSGQAVYVSTGDQLRQVFLSVGDQLRRQYVLHYTSKLPADDSTHDIIVKTSYRGLAAEGTGKLIARRAKLVFEVAGLVNASRVDGTRRIDVTLTEGTAREVELLVDDQSRAKASAAPFTFQWDATKESPGLRRVVVRVKDSSGASTDREFVVEVATAAPTSIPASVPTPVPAISTPAPGATVSPVAAATVPAPAVATRPDPTSPLLYVAAGVAVVGVVGGAAGGILLMRRRRVPPPPPPPPSPPVRESATVVTDRTEAMGFPIDGEGTVVGGAMAAPAPARPKGRLMIVQQGTQSEVILEQAETIAGREATNPIVIKDPLSSRKHAKITIENGEFWIEDLKSLNGTKVNGDTITRHKLSTNDQIRIGEVTLTFVKG
jgi:Ca-activated chloride channel homolog